jgi:hypothetical protein
MSLLGRKTAAEYQSEERMTYEKNRFIILDMKMGCTITRRSTLCNAIDHFQTRTIATPLRRAIGLLCEEDTFTT